MTTAARHTQLEPVSPGNAVLLFVDQQHGLFSRVHEPQQTRANLIALARSARLLGIPAVMTTALAAGPNGPQLPELTETFAGQEIIDRTLINAWHDSRIRCPAFASAATECEPTYPVPPVTSTSNSMHPRSSVGKALHAASPVQRPLLGIGRCSRIVWQNNGAPGRTTAVHRHNRPCLLRCRPHRGAQPGVEPPQDDMGANDPSSQSGVRLGPLFPTASRRPVLARQRSAPGLFAARRTCFRARPTVSPS
jgi:hypothetical protein